MKSKNKVMVWHQGALGDLILSFPAIQAIKLNNQEACIHLVSRTDIASLAVEYRVADVVSSCEEGLFGGLFAEGSPTEGLKAFLSGFGAAFVFMRRENGEFMKKIGEIIPRTFSVRTFPPEGLRKHVASFQLEQLKGMGLNAQPGTFVSKGGPDISSPPRGEVIVSIHPGSGGRKKCWPLENYLDLIRSLGAKGRRFIVILGPAEEGRLHERIFSFSSLNHLPVEVLTGMTVDEVSAAILRSSAYIGNDSGVTHLAALLGTPTIAVFGPTDEEVWGPSGRHVRVVRSSVSCAPCREAVYRECPDIRCISAVAVRDVQAEVRTMLEA